MHRAALFDLDGTLVLTNIDFKAMKRSVVGAALAHGVDLGTLAHRDSLFLIDEACRRLGEGCGPFRLDALAAIEAHEQASLVRAQVAEGAPELLAWLRATGTRVAIVTRNGRGTARELVARFGLAADALLTRDDVLRVKPEPAHLHDALEIFGCKPAEGVMVGDHAMDIAAARAAGMRHAVAVAHHLGDTTALSDARPDALARSCAELRAALERLGREVFL